MNEQQREIEQSPDEPVKEFTICDFAAVMNIEGASLIDLVNTSSTIGETIVDCLTRVTKGLKPWEYKFLASYSLIPSILCRILPIVQIIGQSGSGKSQLLLAISKISGQMMISGQSTGASLKNHINKIRWSDSETKTREKNCLLLIDNLTEDSFKKEEYLSCFLNGYNRLTDRTYISNGKGENIEFRTFCGKAYTTIWENKSTELRRRTVCIRTSKSADLASILDIEDIKWSQVRANVNDFWHEEDNWLTYSENRITVTKYCKPGMSKEMWILLRDVLAVGITTGCWNSVDECISDTFEWLSSALRVRSTLLEAMIILALEEELGIHRKEWESLSKTVRIYVSPKSLQNAIDIGVKDGLIERPKVSEIQEILGRIGFTPGKRDKALGYSFKGLTTLPQN
jgi:energy-coupling factor transporter ATP-binding protein EcfA2